MVILRIQHPVPSFEGWKQAFDGDPMDRKGSGVRRYQVFQSLDDPKFVMIDLEFDTVGEAESVRTALRTLWENVNVIGDDPQARIVEVIEAKEY